MGWLGWIAGAIAGGFFGRAGSIIGGLIGSFVEEGIKNHHAKSSQEKEELYFYGAVFMLLAKLAKADGRIHENEILYVNSLFDQFHLVGERREYCKAAFRRAKDDSYSIYDYATDFVQNSHCDASVVETLYGILWNLAGADGQYSKEELEILQNLPRYLGLDPAYYRWEYSRRLGGSSSYNDTEENYEDFCAILGVKASATEAELKAAYRTKAREYHPDRLKAQGVTDAMLEEGNAQMARINEAWEKIKELRGIK